MEKMIIEGGGGEENKGIQIEAKQFEHFLFVGGGGGVNFIVIVCVEFLMTKS